MIVRIFADATGGHPMKGQIRVEMLDRTDRVYPGARFTPCVPKLPGVYDQVEPIYAAAIWEPQSGEWAVPAQTVGMKYGPIFTAHSRHARAVDLGGAMACALVCVTGVRIREGKYDAAGVVLDVVLPAGEPSNNETVKWPGGCRSLFSRLSSFLPAPPALFDPIRY